MNQTFAEGPPRVRQLTADEATVLVWRDAGAFGILRGGHCGHAAIMLRSDKLPIWSQDEIKVEQSKIRSLVSDLQDHRAEAESFLPQDIEQKKKQIAALGAGGGVTRIKFEQELSNLQARLKQEQAEVARLQKEIAAIQMWNNPNIVRWYYLSEPETGFVRHVYISWFPGGDGVSTTSLKEMLNPIKGVEMEFREDMDAEMSGRVQQRLRAGEITARPGQVHMGRAYGMKQKEADEWGKEPDYVISVPALGASNRYWGLNTARMWTWWCDFKDDADSEYKMISKSKSCAGIALRALVQGGAESFSKLPKSTFYVLPNEVAHYGIELRAAIVDFNNKAMRFEYKVLQMWAKSLKPLGGSAQPPHKRTELWTAADWRSNRDSQARTRFSVGDHLEKYHAADPTEEWARKYRLLAEIFSYVVDQVGDSWFLVSNSGRKDALIILGSQCLNVMRDSSSWVHA